MITMIATVTTNAIPRSVLLKYVPAAVMSAVFEALVTMLETDTEGIYY